MDPLLRERRRQESFCVYEAPSPEAIRKSSARNDLPVDSITLFASSIPTTTPSPRRTPCRRSCCPSPCSPPRRSARPPSRPQARAGRAPTGRSGGLAGVRGDALEDASRDREVRDDLSAAKADGYGIITKMIPDMGYHYMNPKITGFDVTKPPILVYEKRGGTGQLGALEWVFTVEADDAAVPRRALRRVRRGLPLRRRHVRPRRVAGRLPEDRAGRSRVRLLAPGPRDAPRLALVPESLRASTPARVRLVPRSTRLARRPSSRMSGRTLIRGLPDRRTRPRARCRGRPGKRSSRSSRRRETSRCVPTTRVAVTPASRRILRWCDRVESLTGSGKRAAGALASAPGSPTISRRTGRPAPASTAGSRICVRSGISR